MSGEELVRISDDIKKFESWFDSAVKLPNVDVEKHDHLRRMKENMRMAWRECCKVKNKEHEELQKILVSERAEISKLNEGEMLIFDGWN